MDPDEERPTSPVSSLLANEVPSPRSDRSRSENGLLKSVSGIGAEMIYSNLNYFIPVKGQKEGKQIIKNCNGFMGPGVNAILGPTGSGKTTLLGMLAGRTNDAWMKGDIFVNGEPRKKSFRLQCGFVVQDDVVMGTLTVRENLAFSAALRLSSEYSDSDRKARVEQIIQDLGLSQCADTRVGFYCFLGLLLFPTVGTDERRGISGGERRRTSIGMELIISPDVLFLDEPTTGLDATTACTVVKLLQRQARRGRTVIFSIHQPRYSIFKLFDTLTLLSNGETIYHGPCGESVQYFAAIGYQCETYNNPADYYMDVIMNHETIMRKGTGQEEEEDKTVRETIYDSTAETNKTLAELYLDSDYYSETCLKIQPVVDSVEDRERVLYKESTRNVDYQSSFCRQMNFVGKRVVKNLFRDPRAFFSQLIVKLVYALIIGGLFFQLKTNEYGLSNRNGVLFFVITDAVFSNLNAIAVFMDERRIFRHEIANGYYRVSSYFLSKVIFDILPMRLVPLLIFSSIMYFMVDEENDYISVSSNEELVQALDVNLSKTECLKFYVQTLATRKDQKSSHGNPGGEIHPGIVCNLCDSSIRGIRFKCLECHDFDLCCTCEKESAHPSDHEMLKIRTPRSPNIYFARVPSFRFSQKVQYAPSFCRRRQSAWNDRLFDKQGKCFGKSKQECFSNQKEEKPENQMKDLITDFASVFGLDPEVAVSSLKVFLSNVNDEKTGEEKEKEKSTEAGKAANKGESCKQNLNEDPIEGFVRQSMELFGLNEQILSDVAKCFEEKGNTTKPTEEQQKQQQQPQPSASDPSDFGIESNDAAAKKNEEQIPPPQEAEKSEMEVEPSATDKDKASNANDDQDESSTSNSKISNEKENPQSSQETSSSGNSSNVPQYNNLSELMNHIFQSCSGNGVETNSQSVKSNDGKPDDFVMVDDEEKYQQRLDKALRQMEAMGFDNEGGWLRQLLVSKDLSVARVLDALNP